MSFKSNPNFYCLKLLVVEAVNGWYIHSTWKFLHDLVRCCLRIMDANLDRRMVIVWYQKAATVAVYWATSLSSHCCYLLIVSVPPLMVPDKAWLALAFLHDLGGTTRETRNSSILMIEHLHLMAIFLQLLLFLNN